MAQFVSHSALVLNQLEKKSWFCSYLVKCWSKIPWFVRALFKLAIYISKEVEEILNLFYQWKIQALNRSSFQFRYLMLTVKYPKAKYLSLSRQTMNQSNTGIPGKRMLHCQDLKFALLKKIDGNTVVQINKKNWFETLNMDEIYVNKLLLSNKTTLITT